MDSKFQSRNSNGYRERRNHHRYHNQDDDNKIDCSIIITNLRSKTTRFEMKKLFKNVGPIVSIYMSMDSSPWKMGKAEVTFKKRSQAVQACKEFDGHRIGEDAIKIRLLNSRAPRDEPRKAQKHHHSHWPENNSMESRRYNRHEQDRHRNSKRPSASHSNSQRRTYSNVQRSERSSPKHTLRDTVESNGRKRDEHPTNDRITNSRSTRETHRIVQRPHHRRWSKPAEDSMETSRYKKDSRRENYTSQRGQRPEHHRSIKRKRIEEDEKPRKRQCSELSEGELEDEDDEDEIPRMNHYSLISDYSRNFSYSQRETTRREQRKREVKDQEPRKRPRSPLSEGEIDDEEDEDENPRISPMSKGELDDKMDDYTIQSGTDSRTPSPGDDVNKEVRKMSTSPVSNGEFDDSTFQSGTDSRTPSPGDDENKEVTKKKLSSSSSSAYSSSYSFSMYEEEELDYEL